MQTRGNQEEWSELRDQLYRFIYSKVRHHEDAEDILQDVFVKSIQGAATLKDPTALSSWMFSIAKNACTDFFRKKKQIDPQELTFLNSDPEEEPIQNALEKCLHRFINQLSDQETRILKDIYLHKMSQIEIARREGMPYSTLKSKVQRAKNKLCLKFIEHCKVELAADGIPMPVAECGCRQQAC